MSYSTWHCSPWRGGLGGLGLGGVVSVVLAKGGILRSRILCGESTSGRRFPQGVEPVELILDLCPFFRPLILGMPLA